ncbi:MAG: hypothetical protein WDO71_08435 [Bacteroidota bacterium]
MLWNTIPLGVFLLLGFWEKGKFSVWAIVFLLVFFTFVYYAGGWEHRIYKKRKRELETLQKKLKSDELSTSSS